MPEFDVIAFERALGEIRKETAGTARNHAQQLRASGYKELACAIMAVTAAILALIMNRMGYPIVGVMYRQS